MHSGVAIYRDSVCLPVNEPWPGIIRCEPNDRNVTRVRSGAHSITDDRIIEIVFIAACTAHDVEVMLFGVR